LQPGADCFGASMLHEMLNGLIDKSAALPGFRHPAEKPNGSFRKDDVDPSTHHINICIVYTISVYSNRGD